MIAGVKKLEETLKSTFLGDFLLPWFDVNKAKAQARILDIKAESLRKNIDIPIKLEDENGTLDTSCMEELLKRAENTDLLAKIYKQNNRDSIVSHAVQLLENVNDVSDEPVDPDWMFQFIDCASNIAKEEMQKLWGKVLAGEVKKPGSFSRRTLDTLKNLSTEEAKLLENVAKDTVFVGDNICYVQGNSYISTDIRILHSARIFASLLIKNTQLPLTESRCLYFQSNYVLVLEENITNILTIQHYPLTTEGTELVRLIRPVTDLDSIKAFATNLQKENANRFLKFSLHEVVSSEGVKVNYQKKNLLDE